MPIDKTTMQFLHEKAVRHYKMSLEERKAFIETLKEIEQRFYKGEKIYGYGDLTFNQYIRTLFNINSVEYISELRLFSMYRHQLWEHGYDIAKEVLMFTYDKYAEHRDQIFKDLSKAKDFQKKKEILKMWKEYLSPHKRVAWKEIAKELKE
ncbi:MAG: hypothetical protein ACLFUH_11470, partial [Bacteroidales bacterium]